MRPVFARSARPATFSSTSVVSYNLDRLAEAGYIKRAPGVARGIALVKVGKGEG